MRRIAPAAVLGTAAVALVALFDPAIAGSDSSLDASADTPTTAKKSTTTPKSNSNSQQPNNQQQDTQASGDCAGEEVTGPKITTRWGPVQVAGTVQDGKLCEVHAVAWPDGDSRSYEISQYVIPRLDAAATKSGVEFNSISGATYTSEGYRQSLQGLVDAL